jgi:hypothetical protein
MTDKPDAPRGIPLSVEQAAKRAREIADTSIDPADHRVALALEGALLAQKWRHKRDHEPVGRTDDLPPWSAVSGD